MKNYFQPKNAAWKKMKLNNPKLRVHFEIESQKSSDVLLSFDANLPSLIPVHSIVLDNPNTQVINIEKNILIQVILHPIQMIFSAF